MRKVRITYMLIHLLELNTFFSVLEFKENKNYMDILILTWHMKHFGNIDLFLENGVNLPTSMHGHSFEDIFNNFRKASIKWSTKKCLVDLIAAKSHGVALAALNDLKR